MTEYLPIARMIVLFALLVGSVYTDLAQGKIFNKVTVPALIMGVVISYWQGGLWPGSVRGLLVSESLMGSLVAAGIGGGLLMVYYLKGGISAGDVKLMAAVGAIGTLRNLFIVYALFYASLIGAFMAIAVLIWKGRLWKTLKRIPKYFVLGRKALESEKTGEGEKKAQPLTIRYGVAISVGSMIAWFVTNGLM